MNFVAVVVARSISTAVLSTLASFGMTTARSGIIRQLYDAGTATNYLELAARSYVLAIPLSICFNLVFFAMSGPNLSVRRLKRFAAGSTVFFWLLAGCITALYTKLPFSPEFWCVSTICCGLVSAMGAAELCAKGADIVGLL
jgi:hypothetical protein